jgi:hypothetical protein
MIDWQTRSVARDGLAVRPLFATREHYLPEFTAFEQCARRETQQSSVPTHDYGIKLHEAECGGAHGGQGHDGVTGDAQRCDGGSGTVHEAATRGRCGRPSPAPARSPEDIVADVRISAVHPQAEGMAEAADDAAACEHRRAGQQYHVPVPGCTAGGSRGGSNEMRKPPSQTPPDACTLHCCTHRS